VGEPVYAVGAPQGLELSLSEGIVSQLRGGPPPLIQTTVAISGGSSGGGLFNAEAELVGITTFYLKDAQSLNFALPVEWIAEVAGRKTPERGAIVKDKYTIGELQAELARRKNWKDRAIALKEAQDWQGLLEWSRQETKAAPRSESAWFFLGRAYNGLGRYREAIASFREALRIKPNDANVWNKLGLAYATQGRPREAIEAFQEALRLKPDDDEAWGNLALAYALTGNRSAALEALKELRRYDPKEAEKLFNLIIKP
jgi:tetratricopeptide (TPR) repeat protein